LAKSKKSEPTETELIAWAIPRIAQGHYAVNDDSDSRELWVTERQPDLEEMEGQLLYKRPEAVKEEILRLREDCNFESVQNVLVLLFGNKLGNLLAQQFADAPVQYEFVIALAYSQEKRLVKDVQRLMTKGRERISTASHAAIESKALPEALSVATVAHYSQEVANLFPRLIHRAETLRVLAAQNMAPPSVQNYLEEASKCYLYGRFIACLIVCRSAIEFALRERLTAFGKESELVKMKYAREDSLKNIILVCRPIFPRTFKPTLDDADQVRREASNAVHNMEPSAETCKQMFIKTRGILSELYDLMPDKV